MKSFEEYGDVYDSFYQEKPYDKESKFVLEQLENFDLRSGIKSILELGCGTGGHAFELLKNPLLQIDALDRSEVMLGIAEKKRSALEIPTQNRVRFSKADIRHFETEKTYDWAISLFHVISYLTSNADLAATFQNVSKHLKPNGLFLFDFWSGPGVLNDPPQDKTRQTETDGIEIQRATQSTLYPSLNRVDVKFTVTKKNQSNGNSESFEEIHPMRYLFVPELEYFAAQAGLELVHSAEWLTNQPIQLKSWNAFVVFKKK